MAYIGNYLEWKTNADDMIVRSRYYYAGSTRVAMRTGSSTLNYLLGDHLGSQAITTDSNGNRTGEIRYNPWGTERYSSGTTPTTYHFTGQRLESALGLYYYGARWYDPMAGRFIQADTVIPGGIQGFDRYAYVENNPLKYIDPTGHEYCESKYAVAEDCKGITEYLPDKECRLDADCYDAYTTYYQVVLLLGRAPTDKEILYMDEVMLWK